MFQWAKQAFIGTVNSILTLFSEMRICRLEPLACVLNVPGWTRPSLKMTIIDDDDGGDVDFMIMMMMIIGCLPGDEDVAWFGDDNPVFSLGERVEQQREALESLK